MAEIMPASQLDEVEVLNYVKYRVDNEVWDASKRLGIKKRNEAENAMNIGGPHRPEEYQRYMDLLDIQREVDRRLEALPLPEFLQNYNP